jgi:peptidoglycan hydrolase-like protein with peptidoglycan-binding domain
MDLRKEKQMNKFFGLAIIPLAFLIAGCATCDTSRLDNLDARVKALESSTSGRSDVSSEMSVDKTSVTTGAETMPAVVAPDSPTKADIQACLKNAGYYDGPVDGKFGPRTKKAIEDFQNANELMADGKVGPNTWNKLKKFYTGITESSETK